MDVASPSQHDEEANPDAHSVVLEYIDYTEYLHCDITRSLRLISQLDRDYGICASAVHEIASEYCAVSDANTASDNLSGPLVRARARDLRMGIAGPLNAGLTDREESVAEAVRLYENVDRHFNRLSDIIRNMQKITVIPRAIPIREVSQISRSISQNDHMRITLRLDGQRRASLASTSNRYNSPRASAVRNRTPAARKRISSRGVDDGSVPGSLPSSVIKRTEQTPNSSYSQNISLIGPESSSESDWDAIPEGPLVISDRDRKSSLTQCFTETGERLPWFELQQPELAVLRKRMKKNSSWQPSDAMMLKELDHLGRGVRGFRKWAKRTGQKKDDVDRILEGGDGSTNGIAVGALRRSQDNKGMRLNVMKRAKREREKAEAAAAAAAQTGVLNLKEDANMRKLEPFGNQRTSVRRTPTQAKDVQQESLFRGPEAANRSKPSQNSRRASSQMDAGQNLHGAETLNSRKVRRLRKPLASNGSGSMGEEGEDDDMPIDPNEPTYCLCNRISFGTMVGCDNEDCPKEWFHMECVGLTAEPPKTVKWYCPLCRDDLASTKRDILQKSGRKKRKIGR